jgi:hypothetical protein
LGGGVVPGEELFGGEGGNGGHGFFTVMHGVDRYALPVGQWRRASLDAHLSRGYAALKMGHPDFRRERFLLPAQVPPS